MDNTNIEQGGDVFVTLTANVVAAFVGSSHNRIDPADLPGLISTVHQTFTGLGQTPAPEVKQEPAVSIRSSVKPDYIVCLEDGAKLKMLKRYLRTKFGMTPDQYRAKWGLNADYPMVAPNYAEQRRDLAKKIGLGTARTRSAEGRGGRRRSTEAPAQSAETATTAAAPKRKRTAKKKEAAAA